MGLMKEQYFLKALTEDMKAPFQGTKWRKGIWMPPTGKPAICARGYHVFSAINTARWFKSNCDIWLVKVRGWATPPRHEEDKRAFSEAKLVRKLDTSKEALCAIIETCRPLFAAYKKANQIIARYPSKKQANGKNYNQHFNTICDLARNVAVYKDGPEAIAFAAVFFAKLSKLWNINIPIVFNKKNAHRMETVEF
jgi:hypothetical protein